MVSNVAVINQLTKTFCLKNYNTVFYSVMLLISLLFLVNLVYIYTCSLKITQAANGYKRISANYPHGSETERLKL